MQFELIGDLVVLVLVYERMLVQFELIGDLVVLVLCIRADAGAV